MSLAAKHWWRPATTERIAVSVVRVCRAVARFSWYHWERQGDASLQNRHCHQHRLKHCGSLRGPRLAGQQAYSDASTLRLGAGRATGAGREWRQEGRHLRSQTPQTHRPPPAAAAARPAFWAPLPAWKAPGPAWRSPALMPASPLVAPLTPAASSLSALTGCREQQTVVGTACS